MLVARMNENTAVQDRLESAVLEAAQPCIAFCQWMGLEVAKLGEHLWTDFTQEAFGLVTCYKRLQTQQPAAPPHPPPSLPQPPVQPQLQQPPMRPWSVPPQPSPTFRHQLNQPWQPGPSTSTSTEFQHQGWPSFAHNLSALNTCGLSTYLDPTLQVPGHTSSTLSTPDAHRLVSRASSIGDGQRASTSDVMRAAQHILEDEQNEPTQ